MGVQCTIIISCYESKLDELNEYFKSVGVDQQYLCNKLQSTHGNRACEVDMFMVCMKDWSEFRCRIFFEQLKRFDWDYRDSVQIFYTPSHYKDYQQLKQFDLWK